MPNGPFSSQFPTLGGPSTLNSGYGTGPFSSRFAYPMRSQGAPLPAADPSSAAPSEAALAALAAPAAASPQAQQLAKALLAANILQNQGSGVGPGYGTTSGSGSG